VSYYGSAFAGRRTSSGERYAPDVLTMAHRTLRFGTLVRVTNLQNSLSVVVRVNDRGPFTGGRVGDVSAGAARLLGMLQAGVVQARFEVLGSSEIQTNP
jgi:rare lipoprotein A